MPPECNCLRAAMPRLALLYDLPLLLLSAAALPILQEYAVISVYRQSHQCGERSNAAFRRQSAAKQTSLAPHDSKARLQNGDVSQGFMAKPCTPHPIAQRVQSFKLQTANVGGRGGLPSPFSGGSKGGILFGKRIPPLPRVPTAVGQNTAPFGHPKREYSFRCMNKKRSTNKRKLRITYHEQNENRYDHCLRTA